MSSITLDNVINVTNTLCQVIVAVAAIVAIIITFKQIQSKKKSNLRVSYSFGLSLMAKEDGTREIFEVLNIKIRNVGIAPAYYDDCGIMFVKNKKDLSRKEHIGICIAQLDEEHKGTLKPGDSVTESTIIIDEFVSLFQKEHQVLNDDKVYIYVNLCNGKKLYWDTGDTYIKFKEKHNSANANLEESMKSFTNNQSAP